MLQFEILLSNHLHNRKASSSKKVHGKILTILCSFVSHLTLQILRSTAKNELMIYRFSYCFVCRTSRASVRYASRLMSRLDPRESQVATNEREPEDARSREGHDIDFTSIILSDNVSFTIADYCVLISGC